MRRNLVSQFNPVILRKGVTAREIRRNTSVRIPVVRVTNSKGFAPTCFRYTSVNRSTSGTTAFVKRTSLAKRVSFIFGAQASLPAQRAQHAQNKAPRLEIRAL